MAWLPESFDRLSVYLERQIMDVELLERVCPSQFTALPTIHSSSLNERHMNDAAEKGKALSEIK